MNTSLYSDTNVGVTIENVPGGDWYIESDSNSLILAYEYAATLVTQNDQDITSQNSHISHFSENEWRGFHESQKTNAMIVFLQINAPLLSQGTTILNGLEKMINFLVQGPLLQNITLKEIRTQMLTEIDVGPQDVEKSDLYHDKCTMDCDISVINKFLGRVQLKFISLSDYEEKLYNGTLFVDAYAFLLITSNIRHNEPPNSQPVKRQYIGLRKLYNRWWYYDAELLHPILLHHTILQLLLVTLYRIFSKNSVYFLKDTTTSHLIPKYDFTHISTILDHGYFVMKDSNIAGLVQSQILMNEYEIQWPEDDYIFIDSSYIVKSHAVSFWYPSSVSEKQLVPSNTSIDNSPTPCLSDDYIFTNVRDTTPFNDIDGDLINDAKFENSNSFIGGNYVPGFQFITDMIF